MFKRAIAIMMLLTLGVSTLGAATAVACDHATTAAQHHGGQHQPMPASHTDCPMGCPAQASCGVAVSLPASHISLITQATSTLVQRVTSAIPPVRSITAIFHPPRNF